MNNLTTNNDIQQEQRILTSRNSPELAERIRKASTEILERNYKLYKDLENK